MWCTYVYNGILFSLRKQGNPAISNNMDKTQGHYTKWNKPGTERQINAADITYMWYSWTPIKKSWTPRNREEWLPRNERWRKCRDVCWSESTNFVTNWMSSGEVRWNMVTIVNNNVYLKFARKVDLKSS